VTPEDNYLLELRIVDGLRRDVGSAQESKSQDPKEVDLHFEK
jgi:hypothetical protein